MKKTITYGVDDLYCLDKMEVKDITDGIQITGLTFTAPEPETVVTFGLTCSLTQALAEKLRPLLERDFDMSFLDQQKNFDKPLPRMVNPDGVLLKQK